MDPIDLAEGTNCIALWREIYRDMFGVQLPVGLWPKELVADEREFFQTLKPGTPNVVGDTFVFGKKQDDLYQLHIATFTGITDDNEDPLLIHATNRGENMSTLWPLSRFLAHPRYERIYAVKRLQEDLFTIYIKPQVQSAIISLRQTK